MCKPLHIVIGITGGIAAYKSLSLIRLFKKAGAEVKVVATRHALEFVTSLTLQTLSQNNVYSDMFAPAEKVDVEPMGLPMMRYPRCFWRVPNRCLWHRR